MSGKGNRVKGAAIRLESQPPHIMVTHGNETLMLHQDRMTQEADQLTTLELLRVIDLVSTECSNHFDRMHLRMELLSELKGLLFRAQTKGAART